MQAKDRRNIPVQSPELQTDKQVTKPIQPEISISEQRWEKLQSSFPFGLPAVVALMMVWVLFQIVTFGDRAEWPQWAFDLPKPDITHESGFFVATLALLVLVLVKAKSLRPLGLRTEGLAGDLRWFVLASMAMAGLYLTIAGLGYLGLLVFSDDAGGAFRQHLRGSFFKDTSHWDMFRVVLLYPVLEEIWYRGLLYTPIRRERGRGFAIVLTALIFAFAHGNAYPVNQFLGGLVFAMAYEARRGLLAPTLLHIAGNGALLGLGLALQQLHVLD